MVAGVQLTPWFLKSQIEFMTLSYAMPAKMALIMHVAMYVLPYLKKVL